MDERRIYQIFRWSILLKGLDGLVEIGGGAALALVGVPAIVHFVRFLTQDELAEDPHDFVAVHLLSFAHHFSISDKHFYAAYLLGHGAIKIFLVAGLLRKKLWAYPAALAFIALFIVYQLYRYFHTHSPLLIALTVFDAFVIVLIMHEYRLLRKLRKQNQNPVSA